VLHLSPPSSLSLARASAACLVFGLVCGVAPAAAQDAAAQAERTHAFGAWTLVGIDAGVGERWRASVRAGYLSELEMRVSIVDVFYLTSNALQLTAGHLYLGPERSDTATSVLRAGVVWLPVRRRIVIDNRLLIERRSIGSTRSIRARDRVRLAWSPGKAGRVGLFATFETFAVADDGLAEQRYQVGAARRLGRTTIESSWLQRRTRARFVSNSVGLTMCWRVGTA
jgi:hypothetical protein